MQGSSAASDGNGSCARAAELRSEALSAGVRRDRVIVVSMLATIPNPPRRYVNKVPALKEL
jgi:hypothetical protein